MLADTNTATVLPQVLLALAAVIVVGRLLGMFLSRLGQPAVIGQVIAGIALGPSLLGWLCRPWTGTTDSPLLPAEVEPALSLVAQLGVILYMFLIGVEFNAAVFRKLARSAAIVSAASIIVPFACGIGLALVLHAKLAPPSTPMLSFALFVGVALAITAFPVLARILTDRGMAQTDIGILALSCAAIADVKAWWLLAVVAGVVRSQVAGALVVVALSIAYIAVMLLVVRPLMAWLILRSGERMPSPAALGMVVAGLLLSALATESIGIHALFGAFLFGVIIPHDSALAKKLGGGMQELVTMLLLPAFFAYTGMRTQIGLISGWENWLICGLIIVVASLGKFGGTLAAARFAGLDWRTGSALGVLMNTRGLMELIVLNIGLDLGVISPIMFAMLVIMALVTTMATTPLLALLAPQTAHQSSAAAETR
ncbi:MAG TPA: cation:proton antiporter [Pirellulaceae bacterium]|nr:cation:proton antiporter [Pirellulaceae bacterium]